jgi:hypothetical protein
VTSADQAPPARGDRRSRGDGPRVDVARRLSTRLGVRGFLAGLAGVIAAVWPEITALVLALAAVMGVAALLIGVALLWAAWQVRTGRVVVLRIALPTGG